MGIMDLDFRELIEGLQNERESEYVEFKGSNYEMELFGELVSALANGATLDNKEEAYLVYGINDEGRICGTSFDPYKKYHNQPFINVVETNLEYADQIRFRVGEVDGEKIVVIIIPCAKMYPVEYKGVPYVRVDSAKKKLRECPELARKLWESILKRTFEDGYATGLISEDDVFGLLDFSPYYVRRNVEYPASREQIIAAMLNEGVLVRKVGKFYVTNLGAIMFARDLSKFDSLINRGIRLIKYVGNDKMRVERSIDFVGGYAVELENVFNIIKLLLPTEEYMEGTVRKMRVVFPDEIMRELLPNELVHQDFAVGGYAPRVEIYANRIEFTNAGLPLIDTGRFLDLNRSRNPKLAKLCRFLGMCEERGMGIDKVEAACERSYLPSLNIVAGDGVTRVVVFNHKSLRQFTSLDRTNLVYMHCCLQHVRCLHLTNESLRLRFPSGVMSPTVASRWIKEALGRGVICSFDDGASRKNASYVPVWSK